MKNLIFKALMVFAAFVMIVGMLSGCATQRKAEKFYAKHPAKLAVKCANEYPVQSSVDSTEYKKSIDRIRELEEQNRESENQQSKDRDFLLYQIKKLKEDSIPNCKELVILTERLAENEKNRADSFKKINTGLIEAAKKTKPVVIKERDTAAEQVLKDKLDAANSQFAKCEQRGADKDKEISSLKDQVKEFKREARSWKLALWLLVAGIVIGVVLKFRSKLGF